MDIPSAVLEKFKCGNCGVYLSRGPVYLQHDGVALCGRCFTPELPASRNTQYEAVAHLLRFPCKYSELGCDVTVPYVQEDEVIAHEEVCAHRHWVCPVLGPDRCDWLGPRADILQHCQDRHPDCVFDNPCNLEHDITRSSDRTFILRAFKLLFLLKAKVCVSSAKIYYSVRHLGSSDGATNFTYNLVIKLNDELLSKKGQVAPQGCLANQEDTSLALDINSLLSVLGGFTGASFTVEVKQRMNQPMCKAVKVCTSCGVQGTELMHRTEHGWLCELCVLIRRTCKNQVKGCRHQDIHMKCVKHELFFCQQRTKCFVCGAAGARDSLPAHVDSACKAVCRAGSTWRAKWATHDLCLVSSAAGTAVCDYWLDGSSFEFRVYSPLPSERLHEFRCVLRVTQCATGQMRTFTPHTRYDECDWYVEVWMGEFPRWDCELFDVNLDITKVHT